MGLGATFFGGIIAVTAGFGALRAAGWWRRRRCRARLDGAALIATAEGVGVAALFYRTRAVAGLDARRRHRLHGDLWLTADRFLLGSTHGVLLDVGMGGGPPVDAVRCPGPGRLVLEGVVPRGQGLPGHYRFELSVPDAAVWAQRLRPFAREVVVAPGAAGALTTTSSAPPTSLQTLPGAAPAAAPATTPAQPPPA
jgi:hypothetical protein